MKSMRQLINLMEGISTVPGIGQKKDTSADKIAQAKNEIAADEPGTIVEKSTSEKQARFMAAAAHDPKFAKKTGMDASVAKEFNKADTGTKQLSNAMKHKKEESVDEAQVDKARMSNPASAVDACKMEEGARPGTYEVPTAWRKAQGQKPLTPQDVQRHDYEDKISSKEMLAKNSGRTPPTQDECTMEESEGSRAGEWAMMRFGELTNSFVEPEEAMEVVMRELQSQGVSVEDLADAEEAIMSTFGGEEDMGDGEPHGSYDMSDDADALASAGHGSDEDYGDYGGHDDFEEGIGDSTDKVGYALKALIDAMKTSQDPESEVHWVAKTHNVSPQELTQAWQQYTRNGAMDEDLNNGYDDINDASGNDFFPNGADSPVVSTVGPSGARQGDNPEQKKMQVAEVHKELVYGYRNYLNEAAAQKKKLTESHQVSDLSIQDFYGDFDTGSDSIEYNGSIQVTGKALNRQGKPVEITYDVEIASSASVEWEEDESPTGWNHSSDQPTYTSSVYASASTPEVSSVSFIPDQEFYIDGAEYSIQGALEQIDPSVIKQLLHPALYVNLLGPAFDKQAENIEPPEPDFNEPDYGGDDY